MRNQANWSCPLAVIMAYHTGDSERPCGLIACIRPSQATLEYHHSPWSVWPGTTGFNSVTATAELRIELHPPGVMICQARTWSEARTGLYDALRDRGRQTGADIGRAALERNDYQGAYENIPHLTVEEALEMIDEAIRMTGESR